MTLINYSDQVVEETMGTVAIFQSGRWYNTRFTRSVEVDVEFVRNPYKDKREFHIRGMLEQYPLSERKEPRTFAVRVASSELHRAMYVIRSFIDLEGPGYDNDANSVISALGRIGQLYPTAEMIVVPDTKTAEIDRITAILERSSVVDREHAMRALRSLCSDTVDGDYDVADGVLAKVDPAKLTPRTAKGLAIVTFDARDDLPHWLDYARRVSATVGPFNPAIEAILQASQNTLDKPEPER